MALRTEYPFVLHKGFVDADGDVHRRGTMRLATARDEIEPLRDPRVTGPDDPLLTIIVLSRVVTELGSLSRITTKEIEGLFAADLAYLQDFYGVVNFGNADEVSDLLRSQEARVQADLAASAPEVFTSGSDDDSDDDPQPSESRSDGASSPMPTDHAGAGGRRRGAIEEVTNPER